MYYARFLKPPVAAKATRDILTVKALVVVTTDLGEVNCPHDVALQSCLVVDEVPLQRKLLTQSMLWPASSHALSVNLNIQRTSIPSKAILYLQIAPFRKTSPTVQERNKDFALALPHIIGCSAPLTLDHDSSNKDLLTLRNLPYVDGTPSLSLWEDVGPSIDRHVWDAGMAMTALLSGTLYSSAEGYSRFCPPDLKNLICEGFQLRAIELGAGVGLVGLSLAHLRSIASESRASTSQTTVVLTDVESARPIAEQNIGHVLNSLTSLQRNKMKISFTSLDWAESLPSEIENQNFDLVIVSDCTYNPDSGQALVKTLVALAKHSPGALVVVASKTRHESEQVFWERMTLAGFKQGGRRHILLPQSSVEEGLDDADVANVDIFMMQ